MGIQIRLAGVAELLAVVRLDKLDFERCLFQGRQDEIVRPVWRNCCTVLRVRSAAFEIDERIDVVRLFCFPILEMDRIHLQERTRSGDSGSRHAPTVYLSLLAVPTVGLFVPGEDTPDRGETDGYFRMKACDIAVHDEGAAT